jgi:hypothetical protein
LTALFVDELSQKEISATTTVKVHKIPYRLELEKLDTKIKPGLPFKVTAVVTYHDKNMPVIDTNYPVKFKLNHGYDVMKKCRIKKVREGYDYSVKSGVIKEEDFVIVEYDCREKFTITEEKEVFLDKGRATIDVELKGNSTDVAIEVYW